MSHQAQKFVKLIHNVNMPIIGLGTFQISRKEIFEQTMDAALKHGYRLFDTAPIYGTEAVLANSLKTLLPKYNLQRKDIFLSSKLPITHFETSAAKQAIDSTLKNLQTEYLDVYVINFPGAHKVDVKNNAALKKLRTESWSVLEKYQADGKLKAIGVSNYTIHHLSEMESYSKTLPSINQSEFHPYNVTNDLLDFCIKHKIHLQAHSPLGSAKSKQALLKDPVIIELSQKYKCQPSQLVLAWAICQNVSVIPKSTNADHLLSNMEAGSVKLDESDIRKISALNKNQKFSWDPTKIA